MSTKSRNNKTTTQKSFIGTPNIPSNPVSETTGVSNISENAKVVLKKRYLKKNSSGEIIETPEEMFKRVAKAISQPELIYTNEEQRAVVESNFNQMMLDLDFIPNSPTLMNAGIYQDTSEASPGTGTLSACFVMGLEDTMSGIMETAKEMALVQKFGGGTGFSLSPIRPKDSPIKTTHGKACGPIAVLRHLSSVSKLVTQGGKRDGANMAVLDVHHPDILEFIDCKHEEGEIHNFNISVGASHEFMNAVKEDTTYELRDPETNEVVNTLNARDVFNKIVDGAWRNGEPGLIFLDWVNHEHPTPHIGRMTATNPCGEQPLLPYESCNLGSINLANFLIEENNKLQIDYPKLRNVVRTSVRFLDNVIDANSYSVQKIADMTKATRKIGLGVMGFADMLTKLKIPYNSDKGLEIGRSLMSFIREESDIMSEELAKERGPFPAYEGSRLDSPGNTKIRNACRLTVAPTGTISMIAGCSSGIEPLFALCYRKQNILGGEKLYYINEEFEKIAKESGFYSQELMEYLSDGGSLQARTEVPEWAKEVFVTSADISPEMHVRMQAAFQDSVDAAISKTINFPNEATKSDVNDAYMLAWDLKCKGITVYRAGSRNAEVLTTGTNDSAKQQSSNQTQVEEQTSAANRVLLERQRPAVVAGITERVRTGHGNVFVTINYDENGDPFEIFGTLGKAGSSDSAYLEAISRLASLALRSGIDPSEVISHLKGITDEPIWDNGTLIRSVADALALVLSKHHKSSSQNTVIEKHSTPTENITSQYGLFSKEVQSLGQSCPDCTVGKLIFQEGCQRCIDCGYNKCE